MTKFNQQFLLPDGRRLGYDEYGSLDGKALFYFHGSPSSRVESALYVNEELLQSLNVRLVAADRPGMGLSDFQPDRRLLDWRQDVLALADHLNIERFVVLAYSLGGPYGAACAYAVSERLTKIGIVSGTALFTRRVLLHHVNEGTRRFLNLPRENPRAARLFLWMLGATARFAPNRLIAQAKSLLPGPDREIVLSGREFQQGFIAMVREAFRQGVRGAYHGSLLTVTDWGFRLEDIQRAVSIWHGEADQNIPVEMARYMASAIPKCEIKLYPNNGHLSLFKKHAEEIIRSLVP